MFVYPRNTNKVGWSYFHFDALEVSGVSELNTQLLTICLDFQRLFHVTLCRITKGGVLKIHQTDDTTKYAITNIL